MCFRLYILHFAEKTAVEFGFGRLFTEQEAAPAHGCQDADPFADGFIGIGGVQNNEVGVIARPYPIASFHGQGAGAIVRDVAEAVFYFRK